MSRQRQDVEPAVRRMMRALVHRGPDDGGFQRVLLGAEQSGYEAGFGFRRLSILDLSSGGHQPMVDAATGNCIVFNGEIYNFRELRRRLEADGVVTRSGSDTEVLLHSLSRWGEQALAEIDGMFAFAFYEARSRRFLLARDHLGIKPLYVGTAPGTLVFASEIRAVLASGLISDELDPGGLASYMAYGSPQDPLTLHRAIRSFPAGSCLWVDAGGVDAGLSPARRYWHFPDATATCSEGEAVATIRHHLEAAVAAQTVADVPVGVFLSAGIDSGLIAALARRAMPSIHTHSVGFTSRAEINELRPAAETARAIGTIHAETVLDDRLVLESCRRWLATADRPSIDGFNTFIVSGAAKAAGLTVALSGAGADELFGGYPFFRLAPRHSRWLRPFAMLPPATRAMAASLAFAPLGATRRRTGVALVAEGCSPLDLLLRFRRIFTITELESLGLRSEECGLSGQYLPAEVHASMERKATRDTFHLISEAECGFYLLNTILRDTDTNSMAHSLEVRVPFLGRQVVDHAASLPGSRHDPPRGRPKHLLCEAGRDLLPTSVFTRPKNGFVFPIGEWMLGPLRELCEAAVATAAACPLLESAAVRSIWSRFTDNPGSSRLWQRPWALVALGNYLGLQHGLDNRHQTERTGIEEAVGR